MKRTVKALGTLAATLFLAGFATTTAAAAPPTTSRSEATVAAAAPRCDTNLSQWTGAVTMITQPVYQPQPWHVDPNCVIPAGTRADFVYSVQWALKKCHQLDPGPIDGIYGSKTTAAVATLQRRVGIKDDGVYGPQTEDHMKWPVHNGAGRWWNYCDRI